MNTIIEIFAQDSDKAKLIIVLITALITISVVMLNHHFQQKRDSKELYRSKIEELYGLSTEYTKNASELLNLMFRNAPNRLGKPPIAFASLGQTFEVDKEVALNKVNNSIVPMKMLCNLYFHDETFNFDSYEPTTFPIINGLVSQNTFK
ncbi:hypothetical protein V6260_18450 [Pseudoalteromonas aliena]|uniref:hypothetical protein n=1 Tax=Pseudoalteromonas aliena TaxID=247523 RepID=UPI00311D86A7